MRYYEMKIANENRWNLAIEGEFEDGTPTDIWAYSMGRQAPNRPVPFSIYTEGEVVDYNPTAFGTIVVSSRMATIIDAYAESEVQRLSAAVDGEPNGWEVINVLSVVDCIDRDFSDITYYPEDHIEKPGKPRGITKLVLEPQKARGHQLFKPKDWLAATIVSSSLKDALEESSITGIEFWRVTK
ncbi:MAG: DUF1629 domain-containing protein [Planctomycetota bacterium]